MEIGRPNQVIRSALFLRLPQAYSEKCFTCQTMGMGSNDLGEGFTGLRCENMSNVWL